MSPIPNSRRCWPCRTTALLVASGIVAHGAYGRWLARQAPELPSYYLRDYDVMIDAMYRKGRITVYSTTDSLAAYPLIHAFETYYPSITADYHK